MRVWWHFLLLGELATLITVGSFVLGMTIYLREPKEAKDG